MDNQCFRKDLILLLARYVRASFDSRTCFNGGVGHPNPPIQFLNLEVLFVQKLQDGLVTLLVGLE